MLRIHLLQQWSSLSDPAMEEALIEVPTMRRFAGIDLISDRIPDETTILSFRHLLEKHQTKKGNQWYYGMKIHIGVDKDSGLIHSVATTAANVHDLTPVAELLHGDEEVVYGDAGYNGIAKRRDIAGNSSDRDGPSRRLLLAVVTRTRQGRASVPGYQTTVRLPENPAAWHGQEPLQGQPDRCAHEPILSAPPVALGDMNGRNGVSEGPE